MNNKHIAVFTTYLNNLVLILEKIEPLGGAAILNARLVDDMFPLSSQVEIAASFALRCCCPIAGTSVVSFVKPEKSFPNLKEQLRETIAHLAQLDSLSNSFDITVQDQAGPVPVALPAQDFLLQFGYPNFFFHVSMVYAIGRAEGIPLTKGDFDGIHDYPPGFSFE